MLNSAATRQMAVVSLRVGVCQGGVGTVPLVSVLGSRYDVDAVGGYSSGMCISPRQTQSGVSDDGSMAVR